ncbi:MAG: heparan-alpha-glucosaminide N-acetyltransferase domain-containing protein [Bacilli bacterium]
MAKKERIWEIDFLRCLPLILMVLYHFCFDMDFLPSVISNYAAFSTSHPGFSAFQIYAAGVSESPDIELYLVPLFGGIFLFVCGLSTSLSHNNLRRGLLLWLGALVISLATGLASYFLESDLFINFGVIHLMAFCVTLYALLDSLSLKLFKKELSSLFLLALGLLILLIGVFLNIGFKTSTGSIYIWPVTFSNGGLVNMLKKDPWSLVLSALGYYANTTDWWPIFPFGGVIFIGMALGKNLYGTTHQSLFPKISNCKVIKPFCFFGRHTIWVYLLHQPILILILFVVLTAMGAKII